MLPILFSLGPITISTFGFFALVAFIAGSFFLWRRLRDDYPEEDVLSLAILVALGVFLGSRLIYLLTPFAFFSLWQNPGFSVLGALGGGLLVFWLWCFKKSWDFWFIADFLAIAFVLAWVILDIGKFLSSGEKSLLSFGLLAVILLGVSYFMVKTYRRFIWYQSGKPGFAACLTGAIFFLGFSLLEIIFQHGVYWERLIFLILAFFCLGLLYFRSERSLKEDAQNFFYLLKKVIKRK